MIFFEWQRTFIMFNVVYDFLLQGILGFFTVLTTFLLSQKVVMASKTSMSLFTTNVLFSA